MLVKWFEKFRVSDQSSEDDEDVQSLAESIGEFNEEE
jgi:hypothetical protein